MPTWFIPHGGGPCFFMDWSTFGAADTWKGLGEWLGQVASTLPAKPKALLVVSAHWQESEFAINNASKPELLYDYFGFPDHTYAIKYDASGEPKLAERIGSMLKDAGLNSIYKSAHGFDHGVFIPLKLVFPEADIPIVQLSLKNGLDAKAHIALGQALAPLREEGVLIIGSGMSYHNLRHFFGTGAADAKAFDSWLCQVSCLPNSTERNSLLSNWENAPSARKCHPTEEHLIPLMVASGAAALDQGTVMYSGTVNGINISAIGFGV